MDSCADTLYNFVFVEEVHFSFRRVHIYIHPMGVDIQTEVDEWMASFGEEGRVQLLDCLLYRRRFDGTMVDEEKDGRLLDVVVGVAGPSGCLEAPLLVTDSELEKLVRHSTAVDVANAVDGGSIRRD